VLWDLFAHLLDLIGRMGYKTVMGEKLIKGRMFNAVIFDDLIREVEDPAACRTESESTRLERTTRAKGDNPVPNEDPD
jgi:hypothetical protein